MQDKGRDEADTYCAFERQTERDIIGVNHSVKSTHMNPMKLLIKQKEMQKLLPYSKLPLVLHLNAQERMGMDREGKEDIGAVGN